MKNSSLQKPVLRCAWRPISRFCSTVAFSNSSMFWKVRAMPSSAISCGGTSVKRLAVEVDRARGRRVDAADQVEDRGLAGAVGADEREDLALCTSKLTLLTASTPPKRTLRFRAREQQVVAHFRRSDFWKIFCRLNMPLR